MAVVPADFLGRLCRFQPPQELCTLGPVIRHGPSCGPVAARIASISSGWRQGQWLPLRARKGQGNDSSKGLRTVFGSRLSGARRVLRFSNIGGVEPARLHSRDGTLVAPRATLGLAPVGTSVGHRGSFFARTIDAAEARSKLTFEPFDYWYELRDIRPLAACAMRFKSPAGNALLGYENRSDFAVTVPRGQANSYGPKSLDQPQEVFLPGKHEQAHWADYALNLGLVWKLAGDSAAVDAGTRHCGFADLTPEQQANRQSVAAPMPEPRSALPSALRALIKPDIPSSAKYQPSAPFVHEVKLYRRAAPAAGGSTTGIAPAGGQSEGGTAEITQALGVADRTERAPFRFKVTSVHYSESEGACGSVDPYTAVEFLKINKIRIL